LSRDAPAPPWTLACCWCPFKVIVYGRGMRGGDMGAGFEAAVRMRDHVTREHDASWELYLRVSADQ